MSVWKMRRDEVIKLIAQYKRHKCLWDCRSSEYRRGDMKKSAWLQLARLFGREVHQVKKKIQYLRCTYWNDKKKVQDSKKHKFRDVFRSNLFYYKELEFLDSITVLKNGQRVYKFPDPIAIAESADCANEQDHNYVNKDFQFTEDTRASISSPSPFMSAETQQNQSRKKRKLMPYYSMLNAAVKSLTEENQSTPPEETIYSAFGNSIALQLTQLSPVEAASTISEIQQVISKNIVQSMLSKERGEQQETKLSIKTNPVENGNSRLRIQPNDYYDVTM